MVAEPGAHAQPVGRSLPGWSAPPFPPPRRLVGRTVALEPLTPHDRVESLWAEFADSAPSLWTYLPFGPFHDRVQFDEVLDSLNARHDASVWVIEVESRPVGFIAYMRIDPSNGSIEIGSVVFSASLQRTTAATEAFYLFIANVFELGYRRCEWQCDELNAPSRAAARRLGFTYEGTFRNAAVTKGRSRDTAWLSIIDDEWPELVPEFDRWLAPDNFTSRGRQLTPMRRDADASPPR